MERRETVGINTNQTEQSRKIICKLRGYLQDLILDNTRTRPLLLRRGLYNTFVSHRARQSSLEGIRTHEDHALEPI